jgi:CRISPR system Cascade subunit CasC
MTTFVQLHLLTPYPPSNLNRDDTGRPKSAIIGGAPRLPISSQSLKRAWRETWKNTSPFKDRLAGRLGVRTQRLGRGWKDCLTSHYGYGEAESESIAKVFAAAFGSLEAKEGKELFIKQLAFVAPSEKKRVEALFAKLKGDDAFRARIERAASEAAFEAEDDQPEDDDDGGPDRTKKKGKPKQSKQTKALIKEIRDEVLSQEDTSPAEAAIDIALFGRMLADAPAYNREAAAQVAHAFTTHKAVVEDDYYTAVDDLKTPDEDAGAGFVGELGFGAGLFYIYACIDRDLLLKNLSEDEKLAGEAIAALVEVAATISPRGKQASFASRSRALYAMAEKGSSQPRTLAGAFFKPVRGEDPLAASIEALEQLREKIAKAYDDIPARVTMNVLAGQGTLSELVAFCRTA